MNDPENSRAFRELVRLTGQCIGDYALIQDSDRIAVGVSGGKDSMMLMHVLYRLQARAPVKFDLTAVIFDPMFSSFDAAATRRYLAARNWPCEVLKMDVGTIIREKNWTKSPCVLCSRLRRGRLYGFVRERRMNVLALGHHLDDAIASFWMSACTGQGVSSTAPRTPVGDGDPALRLIRPFSYIPEQLIAEAAAAFALPGGDRCEYYGTLAERGTRAYFRTLTDRLAERIPDVRGKLLHSLGKVEVEHLFDRRYLP